MSRESMSIVTSVPTNRKPRTRIDFGIIDHLSSAQHGRLTPNFIKPIFPGDTFNMKDFAGFAYADKSTKLPLNDIVYDQFFFFVPFRIIDRKNWEKVLGHRDSPYDTNTYSIPQFEYNICTKSDGFSVGTARDSALALLCPHLLPTYFGKNLSSIAKYDDNGTTKYDTNKLSGSAYPLMAYWTIWNEFFRDENLDASIDSTTVLTDLKKSANNLLTLLSGNSNDASVVMGLLNNLHIIPERVNKLHDPLTSGMISPQKSPDGQPVTLFLGGAAPVVFSVPSAGSNPTSLSDFDTINVESSAIELSQTDLGGELSTVSSIAAYADLSNATAVDINALRLAFSIQSLYEAKGRFGSRYIEYIRGIWGLSVPDSMLDRPEYLGGIRLAMNNMPVLNQANNLGLFSGYSATLFNGCNFDKTFLEYGFVIGVHCERVRHIYPQGTDLDVWDKLVELDLYNPKFAELGFMGYKKGLIYSGEDSIFNYNEAWTYERAQLSRASGIFGPLGGSTYQEYREKWTYADYYDSVPSFNSSWLKEPTENVARTMTGELIVNATNAVYGFQYMFDFKFHYTITRIIPVYSTPAELGGRW